MTAQSPHYASRDASPPHTPPTTDPTSPTSTTPILSGISIGPAPFPFRAVEPSHPSPIATQRAQVRRARHATSRARRACSAMLPRCFTYLTNAQILEPHTPIRPRHLLESFSKPPPQIRVEHTRLRLAHSSDTPVSSLLRVFCSCCRIHQDNRINPQPLAHSCYHLPKTYTESR